MAWLSEGRPFWNQEFRTCWCQPEHRLTLRRTIRHRCPLPAAGSRGEIAVEIHDTDYGSRDYSAQGLVEGNLWHFGTYTPNEAAEA